MKALSFRNPYGSLMLHGKIETRTWRTEYRGPVLICTSKRQYGIDQIQAISGDEQLLRILALLKADPTLPLDGMAIAVGNLVDCRKMVREDEERCFVRYHPDLKCHVYEDVRRIKPFPVTGRLTLFNVAITIDQLEFLNVTI